MIRQVVSFALGVAVGVSLYSLLRLRPLSPGRIWSVASQINFHHPGNSLRAPWVQRSAPPQVFTPIRVHSEDHVHALSPEPAGPRPRVRVVADSLAKTRPAASRLAGAARSITPKSPAVTARAVAGAPAASAPGDVTAVATAATVTAAPPALIRAAQPDPSLVRTPSPVVTEVAASVGVTLAPPVPKVFQTIGYVEKAGGQVEAIILQDNQVQVVHLGDIIAERYRVTRVTPESVAAVDEAQVKSPMTKPEVSAPKELTAEAVRQPEPRPGEGADGLAVSASSVLPNRAPELAGEPLSTSGGMENPRALSHGEYPIENSLGYVEKSDGKVEAVVADGDSVRLVPTTHATVLAQASPQPLPDALASGHDSTATVASISNEARPERTTQPGGGMAEPASAMRSFSYEVSSLGSSHAEISASGSGAKMVNDGASAADALTARVGFTAMGVTEEVSVDSAQASVTLKPLGFVVRANGDFAAIVADQDEVYVVQKGERFAGHYRALSVSAEAVAAVDEPPRSVQSYPADTKTASPSLLTAWAKPDFDPMLGKNCIACEFNGLGEQSANVLEDPLVGAESPPPKKQVEIHAPSPFAREARQRSGTMQRKAPAAKPNVPSPDPATFVFQNLGYVETQDGVVQAIVAEGSQLYLVKQGEVFADRYRATSVDPILVLAVKASPPTVPGNLLSAQAESWGNTASNPLYGNLSFPMWGLVGASAHPEVGASGGPVLADLRVNLIDTFLTDFDPQSHYSTAVKP